MDPYNEKELIEHLRSIAVSLRNMDRKMDDIAVSLREIASTELDEQEILDTDKNDA